MTSNKYWFWNPPYDMKPLNDLDEPLKVNLYRLNNTINGMTHQHFKLLISELRNIRNMLKARVLGLNFSYVVSTSGRTDRLRVGKTDRQIERQTRR